MVSAIYFVCCTDYTSFAKIKILFRSQKFGYLYLSSPKLSRWLQSCNLLLCGNKCHVFFSSEITRYPYICYTISSLIWWTPTSLPQRLQLAMITISIEINFTTLYMADLGTRPEQLGEGVATPLVFNLNTNRNHSQLKPLRRREAENNFLYFFYV
jgi:hypothetical protein